jgi:MGT family glycosyltransferase
MTHFGLIGPPVPGHLNPLTALGRALVSRGHRVTLIGLADVEPVARASGLGFVAYGESAIGRGQLTGYVRSVGRLVGHRASIHTTRLGLQEIDTLIAELPPRVRAAGIEALIVDKASAAGGTVAELCGVPFVTTMGAFMPDLSDEVPPMCFGWRHGEGAAARARNAVGNELLRSFAWPHLRRLNAHRRRHGLAPYREAADWASPLLQLCPVPRSFELPRRRTASRVECVGPFLDAGAPAPAFPFERLRGGELIYASLGTVHTGRPELYRAIVEATAGLGAQVVLSWGSGDGIALEGADHVLAVRYAPQRELLGRARLAITHGGLNTVMEALAAGVPLVVMPLANDQPGVAERVRFHGLGEVVARRAGAAALRAAVRRVLAEPRYVERAEAMKREIAAGDGLGRAVELIERSVAAVVRKPA